MAARWEGHSAISASAARLPLAGSTAYSPKASKNAMTFSTGAWE